MEKEIWKDVVGYEGLYQVSSIGRVKSRRGFLKPYIRRNYYSVSLSKSGKAKNGAIHQLMAIAFLGHKPCGNTLVVNHKDLNKLNNNLSNLEIVSHRYNSNRKHLKQNATSKYTGVCFKRSLGRFQAAIQINKRTKYLGVFDSEFEAHLAYERALNQLTK